MPTPSQQSSRVPVFLLLVGAAGLLASGVGARMAGIPGWTWVAVIALGALLPTINERLNGRAFDSEERLANDRARESMKWAADRQERLLKDMGDAVAEIQKNALQPGEALEMRKTIVAFAADLQLVKAEIVEMREAEKMRRFGTTFGGQPPEGT